eukprot:10773086-Lingulodinium_polyedra.AAC.1
MTGAAVLDLAIRGEWLHVSRWVPEIRVRFQRVSWAHGCAVVATDRLRQRRHFENHFRHGGSAAAFAHRPREGRCCGQ